MSKTGCEAHDNILRIAQDFRRSAGEADAAYYASMMTRTAEDLEAFARTMEADASVWPTAGQRLPA